MRKRAMRDVFQSGNRSADVDAGTDGGVDITNSGADSSNICTDVTNSGADNSTGGDTATGNVVCRNQTVDEQLPHRLQTSGSQLIQTSDRRLPQFRLQGVTRCTKQASGSQSRDFVPHNNVNCSRIAGGSTSQ